MDFVHTAYFSTDCKKPFSISQLQYLILYLSLTWDWADILHVEMFGNKHVIYCYVLVSVEFYFITIYMQSIRVGRVPASASELAFSVLARQCTGFLAAFLFAF